MHDYALISHNSFGTFLDKTRTLSGWITMSSSIRIPIPWYLDGNLESPLGT